MQSMCTCVHIEVSNGSNGFFDRNLHGNTAIKNAGKLNKIMGINIIEHQMRYLMA